MNGREILQALKQKQLNFALLANACNTSISHISNVANRTTVSKHIATNIARAVGKPISEVFPEYVEREAAKRRRADKVKELAKIVNA